MDELCTKVGLLDAITRSAKEGRALEATLVTTYAFNGNFYEEVLLRAFERAGSRLNVVLVDSAQLATSLSDPVRRNVEAAVLLSGDAAKEAFRALAVEKIASAPSLSAESLVEVAKNSYERRRRANEATTGSITAVAASPTEKGWFVPGIEASRCHSVVELCEVERRISGAEVIESEGGAKVRFGSERLERGIIRLDGDTDAVAYVVLNSPSRIRSALRPRGAARLLENLGRIDNYEGFDELFRLFEEHIFNDDQNVIPSASRTRGKAGGNGAGSDEVPFGPRGVSIQITAGAEDSGQRLVHDDFIADFIAKLIHDLAPSNVPRRDGDEPDIDPEDQDGEDPSRGERPEDKVITEVDWPRLVTACRKRVSTLINRLAKRLDERNSNPDRSAWLAGRALTVLLLLQKLRNLPPPENATKEAVRRLDSLVSVSQLRQAFKIAVRAMYGKNGLAISFEKDARFHRTRDRQLLDAVLFWMAREIGIDIDGPTPFNEDQNKRAKRLCDKSDILIVAMSFAGSAARDTIVSIPSAQPWTDASSISATWVDRHTQLGDRIQKASAESRFPIRVGQVSQGDIVIWKPETGLLRIVVDVAGKNATLAEPGDDGELTGRKIQLPFLSAVDINRLRAVAA